MTADELVELMTSRSFLGLGVPLLSIGCEWIIRLTAKPDSEPTFLIDDFDFGLSLLATAFVSIPALMAARAAALSDASHGRETIDAGALVAAGAGMAGVALLAMLMGTYDRKVGRRYRSAGHVVLRPVLGVFVQLIVGGIALSYVYQLTPTGG